MQGFLFKGCGNCGSLSAVSSHVEQMRLDLDTRAGHKQQNWRFDLADGPQPLTKKKVMNLVADFRQQIHLG